MANDDEKATTCRRSFKAPWLQTERTKNEGPSEKTSFNGEQFEVFKPKNQKIHSSYGEQNKRTTRPQGQKLDRKQRKQEEKNWSIFEKIIQIELLELCKTRTKKISPDLFNFYVIWAGSDLANDDDRATTRRRVFKAPWLQTERTKKWGAFWKNELQRGTVWNFKTKKPKNPLLPWRTKQKNHKTPRAKTEHEPCSQVRINWSKNEKIIQTKNCLNSARLELRR